MALRILRSLTEAKRLTANSVMEHVPTLTRLHIGLQRLVRWEFWPWRIVYLPIAVYWFFLAIKARGWVFFSAANPCMRFGGLVGYSKSAVNELVPKKYLPKTIYLDDECRLNQLLELVNEEGLRYPLIIKPDVGERGWGVKILKSQDDLEQAYESGIGKSMLQEYVNLPIEMGVLYSRHPNEEMGTISSVVVKDFPTVTGDGKRTLMELILAQPRARYSYKVHTKRFRTRLKQIPKAGETIQLVHIGNHMLGTTFYNGNHLIDSELETLFDQLAKQIPGFHVGRFDLRTNSIENLKQGNFVVIEVNGVNSEPCHIFHPGRSIFLAWRDLFRYWKRIADISIANHKSGIPYASFSEITREIKRHNQLVAGQD